MADLRFYDRLGPFSVEEIAALSGAAISDSGTGSTLIADVAPIEEGRAGALSYAEGRKMAEALAGRDLTGWIVLADESLQPVLRDCGAIALVHPAPRSAFSVAAASLFALKPVEADETAVIHETARVGPGAVIGSGADIGADCVIGPGNVIGPGCRIGAGTRLGNSVSVMCADIGQSCNILSGAVIGEAGFGVAVSADGVVDVPHLGQVVIADHVTIGANSTIDRGVFGATRIGKGCKIDNLCHIAHNVVLGENVLLPAYAGISGSTVIGDGVMFGGRVGVSDHVTIGDGARIGSNSAVMGDVPAGETYAGAPAQPIRAHMREIAELRRLVRAKNKKKGS